MNTYKTTILSNLSYTERVYGRINKKLRVDLSKQDIETLIATIIAETDAAEFQKTGKNIYITNHKRHIRLTINSNTNRIITADTLK